MNTLDYDLPESLIAVRPAEPRDAARMLVVGADGRLEDHHVRDLPAFLGKGDRLIFNRTAVLPARFHAQRTTGGRLEGLFLSEPEVGTWRMMLKANRSPRAGDRIDLLGPDMAPAGRTLEIVERDGDAWVASMTPPAAATVVLPEIGLTPLPPYILRARRDRAIALDDRLDRSWYQTVYAAASDQHSVAAPTAGLHFTPALLDRIDAAGVERRFVTLHVGTGTFKPVTTENLADHPMHRESYAVPAATLAELRKSTGRTIAVGTTTVRTLESLPEPLPTEPITSSTDLLIAPPYRFRHVDGFLTNFHLPRSTLLALVAARLGLQRTMEIYEEAVRRAYRFYSYGDAMLILPEADPGS
ncbi:MAG: tRNA preQ1(34) S-adenosylmethionine ribosyltransferase-isomerase QueA [Phycisphaerales bacterium]|nr:tRNA preQ1(34) S-adenosylmethionine ribosyltransferase-isomerase QueA [Phycisphaerales bacterium]